MLLAANNFSNLLAAVGFAVNFCYVILLIGAVLWPFVMLKSPMDFWQGAVGAAASSTVAAILIVAGSIHDAPVCQQVVSYPEFSFHNLFLAYGTIAFAYGGHGAFPTIQHDMTKPFRFNRAVWASYIFILIVYIIVSSTGYAVYGDSMRNTVIPSLQVGGSTITLMTMLLPSVFYLFLFASHKKRKDLINTMQISPDSPDDQLAGLVDIWRYTSKPVLLFNAVSFVFGLIGGIAASYTAVRELLDAKMAPPCYVQWFTTVYTRSPQVERQRIVVVPTGIGLSVVQTHCTFAYKLCMYR
ncbi:hypothetical protein COOONC_10950 [Cooperia oncophora]